MEGDSGKKVCRTFDGEVDGVVSVVSTDCLEEVRLPKENHEIERESTVCGDEEVDGTDSRGETTDRRIGISCTLLAVLTDPALLLPLFSETRASHGLVLSRVSSSSI